MATQYTEEFKNDAVRYLKEHPGFGIAKCAKSLGISKTALSNCRKMYDAKELVRLRKELRDTQDALDILKKATGMEIIL